MVNTNKNNLVSVVLPTYNRAHTLNRAIDSVIKQTYNNWELIIVDNNSTDDTESLINNYNHQKIKFYRINNNGIIAKSRNFGIKKAKGDYIAFLDSDDWWYLKKLEIVMRYFDQADFVYHDLDIYTKTGKRFILYSRWRKLKKPVFNNLMVKGSGIGNLTVVVKKSIIDKVGCLSEENSLIAIEDLDLWIKISLITDKFHFIPKKLGAAWLGGGNTYEVSEKQITRLEAIHNKYVNFLPYNDQQQSKIFLNYSKGQEYYKLGMYEKSFNEFKFSIKSKIFLTRIKSLIYIIRLLIIK